MIEVLKFMLWRLKMGGDISDIEQNPEKYFRILNDYHDDY